MAIQISGCTVIDNSRNITNANNMCVGVVTMTGSTGNIETPGTITAAGIDFPIELANISPSNGQTSVEPSTNIQLTFLTPTLSLGVGTITLRSDSADGTILESFDVETTEQISISIGVITITPTINFEVLKTIFLVIPSTAINGYEGLNIGGGTDSYSFTIRIPIPGEEYGGGTIICNSSNVHWIAAPLSTNVQRSWYARSDAVTTAQSITGCAGWFIPSCAQLQNPGNVCRSFWTTALVYWSDTEINASSAHNICIGGGPATSCIKSCPKNVRAFRCLTY
jgi:hypothetical protein